MRVLLARTAGFCWGVERAMEIVDAETGRADPRPLVALGPLIHNPQVIGRLEARGVKVVKELPAARGDERVIVRAHGATPEVRRALRKGGFEVVDCTCPHVGRSQGLVRRLARKGFHVVIVGDALHAEVVGLVGYAAGNATVVRDPSEVGAMPEHPKTAVVAQSTENRARFEAVVARARGRWPGVAVVDTLCDVTDERQREIPALASEADAIVVVGGRNSANTTHLAEIARALGLPVIHVETAEELREADFSGVETVGVTAGASTPRWIIEAVVERLRAIDVAAGAGA